MSCDFPVPDFRMVTAQGVRRMCVFSVNRRKNIWGDLGKFDHFTFKGE